MASYTYGLLSICVYGLYDTDLTRTDRIARKAHTSFRIVFSKKLLAVLPLVWSPNCYSHLNYINVGLNGLKIHVLCQFREQCKIKGKVNNWKTIICDMLSPICVSLCTGSGSGQHEISLPKSKYHTKSLNTIPEWIQPWLQLSPVKSSTQLVIPY